MQRAVSFALIPGTDGKTQVVVYNMSYPDGAGTTPVGQESIHFDIEFDCDCADNAQRAWLNRAVRMIARTLEDDWYEMLKHSPGKLTAPIPTR